MSQLNTGSKLLNKSENDILISLLPRGSTIQAAGVVELSTTHEPDHSEWFEIGTGVVGFIRDAVRRSYFLQFFNIVERTMTWEEEVYNDLKFQIPSPCQMVFEGETSMICMVFSDEIECKCFCTTLANKVAQRSSRQRPPTDEKTKIRTPPPASAPIVSTIKEEPESTSKPKKFIFGGLKKSTTKVDKRTSKKFGTSRLVIGEPEGFRHLNHIGFDPQKGFDLNKCDSGWKKLFSSLGINEAILTDTKKSNFIFEFVEKNGGIDKLLNEIDVLEKENKPIPNIYNQAQQPPPVTSRPRSKNRPIDDPTSERGPPPPPPPPLSSNYKANDDEPADSASSPRPKQISSKKRQKPMLPPELESTSSEISRSSDSIAPPPPPPPPPPTRSLEPAPPIQNRRSDNKPPPVPTSKPIESASSDPRDALLVAISKGANLKATSEREIVQIKSKESSSLVESLASSLAKMRAVTAGDDDSDTNADVNEEEWST